MGEAIIGKLFDGGTWRIDHFAARPSLSASGLKASHRKQSATLPVVASAPRDTVPADKHTGRKRNDPLIAHHPPPIMPSRREAADDPAVKGEARSNQTSPTFFATFPLAHCS